MIRFLILGIRNWKGTGVIQYCMIDGKSSSIIESKKNLSLNQLIRTTKRIVKLFWEIKKMFKGEACRVFP